MNRKILITGVSGTGKTTTGKALKNLGYESCDIENISGMFEMYHKGTKKIFKNYSNSNPEHVKTADWVCDVGKLKKFLKTQKTRLAFYSGIGSNMDGIIPLFDRVFVLSPGPKTLNERLKNREGTEDIGNTQKGRDIVLGWKDWWESEMKKKGATIIKANGSPEAIAKKILKKLGQEK